jgi:argininosuccinate lyase
MKLWEKKTVVDKNVETFTVGKDKEFDIRLAPFDVLGSIAHIKMLESIGLLTRGELNSLLSELKIVFQDIQDGKFLIEDGVEDVHSQVELLLTRSLGEAGKKIHSGRSRNDQVLLDLKLFLRSEIKSIVDDIEKLFNLFIEKSEKHKEVLMPGYTHFQVAMPSSFGLWFGAYAESLTDDLELLLSAYKIVNKNPLGSAAGYGSSFPLNRQMTTDLLGFESMNYNVVYAQMGRGKVEKILAMALTSVAATLSKMAMDMCLYMSQNFDFIAFPSELTTGSSIMPHKKNPDVLELIRAKCNRAQAVPFDISLILVNLPSGYHRDMQILKELLIPVMDDLSQCIKMMQMMVENIVIKQNILQDEKYKYMFSVEHVNSQVLSGVPFREAYKKVGMAIEEGLFDTLTEINHTHEGSIGNLCNDEITAMMNKIRQDFNFQNAEKALSLLLK